MMPKAVPAEPVGVYNPTTGAFFLKNTNTPGATGRTGSISFYSTGLFV